MRIIFILNVWFSFNFDCVANGTDGYFEKPLGFIQAFVPLYCGN